MSVQGSLRYVVGKNLYLSAYAGNGHYNDMDMMVIGFRNDSKVGGQGLTPTEEEAHFGLWCIDCPQPRPARFAGIRSAT